MSTSTTSTMLRNRLASGFACSALALTGCNAVFGLDEGHVASGGSGGASTSSGKTSTSTMGSPSTSTASIASGTQSTSVTSATQATVTSGAGGGCTVETGLKNGDFALQDTDSPQSWNKEANNTMVNYNTISGFTTGLSMAYATIGANAYGGLYQTNGNAPWNQCVRLSGSSRKKGQTQTTMHVEVLLDPNNIEMDLPVGSDYQTFDSTCQLPIPINHFTLTVEGRNLPQGGTETLEVQTIAFDEVCCTGNEPQCGS